MKITKITAVLVEGSVPIIEIKQLDDSSNRIDRVFAVGQDSSDNESALIAEIAESLLSVGVYSGDTKKIHFTLRDGFIIYTMREHKLTIAPCHKCPDTGNWLDSDLQHESVPEEVRQFAECVFNHERNGVKVYKELYRLQQIVSAGDEPDKPETRKVSKPVQKTEFVDGKAVITETTEEVEEVVYDEYPCVCAQGKPIIDPKTKKQAVIRKPRMIPGRKVSQEDKDRLKALLADLQE